MPITARLSKALYDQLGETVVDELVNWFNQVDATYRADLKDFNNLNFARFDAKLDAFRSEFNAKLDSLRSELDASKVEVIARFEAQLEKRLGDQTRFFFLAWAILLASNIALWFR